VVQIEGVPFGEFGAAREEGDLKVTLIRGKLSSPRLYTGAERHDPAALDRGLDTQIAALETLQRELEAGWQGKR
jgi:hypothetical protein